MTRISPKSRRSRTHLFDSIRGGIVADGEPYTSSASPTVLDPVAYQSSVDTGGTGAAEVVTLAAGASPGQRHYVRMGTRANAADVVRIQAGADTSLKLAATPVAPVVASKDVPAASFTASAVSVFVPAPVSGRITRVRTVVDVLTDTETDLTLELGGTLVEGSAVTIADASTIGTPDDSGAIATTSLTNIVKVGDPIEIVTDDDALAGAVTAFIEITPDAEQAPVVVDALMPNTQFESASIDVFTIAPVAGNISRFRSVVDILTAELAALTLELAGVEVIGSDLAIADGAVLGDTDDSGAITAGATTLVAAGDPIGLVSDGVPTAGAVDCKIEIIPIIGRGPVIVEKVYPAAILTTTTSVFAVAPVAGHIRRVRTISDVAITVADVTIGLELGGVNVAGSDVLVEFAGAAIGDPDDSGAITPGATTLVAAGDPIEITSDGLNTAGELHVFIEIDPVSDVAQIDLSEPGDYALMEFDGFAWNYVKGSGAVA